MMDRYIDSRYNTSVHVIYIQYKRLFSCMWHEMLKLHLRCACLSH